MKGGRLKEERRGDGHKNETFLLGEAKETLDLSLSLSVHTDHVRFLNRQNRSLCEC